MPTVKSVLFYLLIIVCVDHAKAQKNENYKFGQIMPADFNLNADKFAPGANAVVIADIGTTGFAGNEKLFFTMIYTRFLRVKVINKNGFPVGSIGIRLNNGRNDDDRITFLKASTFNPEGGKVVETKLDEKSIHNENYNKDFSLKKFSMPALQEGSIFDIQYTIKSPFDSEIRTWDFQGENPCLWSEYTVTIPVCYNYIIREQGDQQYEINTTKEVGRTFVMEDQNIDMRNEQYEVNSTSVQKHWLKKNIPALRQEPFITTLSNFNSNVSFQLNSFQWTSSSDLHDYNETWTSASVRLLKNKEFGQLLDTGSLENAWMENEVRSIVSGALSEQERAVKIYTYVRDNFQMRPQDGYTANMIYALHSLKDIFRRKEGNLAEINLMLTAMLRRAGVSADPLILSTRQNGYADLKNPIIGQYNYLVCFARLGDRILTLDASDRYNGFGQLPARCYNGWAHVINGTNPQAVEFAADSADENCSAMVLIITDNKGGLTGSSSEVLGADSSYKVRREISETSKKAFQEKIEKSHQAGAEIDNLEIDSLNQPDYPLTVRYDVDFKNLLSGNMVYLNPMLNQGYRVNPFKSMERHYPVEMPYRIDQSYFLKMDIPAGYKVEELPKSDKFTYNGTEGMLEYLIQSDAASIQMRVHLKLNKAVFHIEEYSTLRDFFALVVKKENEQIVFKKIP